MKKIFLSVCFLSMGFLKSSAQQKSDSVALSVKVEMPPFLYEGDRLEVPAIITNRTAAERTGQLQLLLTDAETATSVDGWFQNIFPVQYFTVAAGSSDTWYFPVELPYLFRKRAHWRMVLDETVLDEGFLPVHFTDSIAATAKTPLRLSKRIFQKRPGNTSFVPVKDGIPVYKGDTLKIQLAVWSDRDVKSVQLTDALTAAFVSVISSKRSVKDFQYTKDSSSVTLSKTGLRKGTSRFEYIVVVTHAGLFHSSPATLQIADASTIVARSTPFEIRIEEAAMGF